MSNVSFAEDVIVGLECLQEAKLTVSLGTSLIIKNHSFTTLSLRPVIT